jgi:DNA-binding NtrC family response regulator
MSRNFTHNSVPAVLISEITDSDPYFNGLVSGDEHPGPLIALLASKSFDKVVILADENVSERVAFVAKEIKRKFPSLIISTERMPLFENATSERIDENLRNLVEKIRAEISNCEISVAINGKNPATLVSWLRQTYRFDGIELLLVRQNMHATTVLPEIEVVEESHREPLAVGALREPSEPTVDEIAKELDLVGNHPAFRQLLNNAWAMARFNVPVLVTGEAGSGKTSLATFIWQSSPRADRELQVAAPVDLPDPLAAMLLFGGHGVDDPSTNPVGKIAASNNSTLLIENVEKLSPQIQDSLAKYIATGKFMPVGSKDCATSNARLIFTSGDDSPAGPAKLTQSLREQLLKAVLRIPPLRERRDDIPLIALHYLRHINLSLKGARSMSKEMLRTIQSLQWSGNVRELRLAVERAALLSPGRDIVIDMNVPGEKSRIDTSRSPRMQIPEIDENFSMEAYLGEMRRRLILRALEIAKGNQSEAARSLKITPQAVHQFLKTHNKIKQEGA